MIKKLAPVNIFPKNNQHKGVFQNHINNIDQFVSLDASSTSSANDIHHILEEENNQWMSSDNENEYFNATFKTHVLRLSFLSLYSCNRNHCFKDLDVFGTNTGENWEKICSITEEYSTFQLKATHAKCESDYFYRKFKFQAVSPDLNESNIFTVHYLDMYGELLPIKINFYTRFFHFRAISITRFFVLFISL